MDTILWILMTVVLLALLSPTVESFADMDGWLAKTSTEAINAAPSDSELKNHYRNVLIYAADDINKQSPTGNGMRILADFRNRVYGVREFKPMTASDFLANWPTWLPPLDTTMKEPVPDVDTAVASEAKMLAYLDKNFPAEKTADAQSTSLCRLMLKDFGDRYLFTQPRKDLGLRPDFLRVPLTRGWINPVN
jgi:hypothetical protein